MRILLHSCVRRLHMTMSRQATRSSGAIRAFVNTITYWIEITCQPNALVRTVVSTLICDGDTDGGGDSIDVEDNDGGM